MYVSINAKVCMNITVYKSLSLSMYIYIYMCVC